MADPDEFTTNLIFKENINDWKLLKTTITRKENPQIIKNKIIQLCLTRRRDDEDIYLYINNVMKSARELEISEDWILRILSVKVWPKNSKISNELI